MIRITGTKWNPSVLVDASDMSVTKLTYRTAYEPNNRALERLHRLTGWEVHNAFEEEQPEFEGELHCANGDCKVAVRP
ncbi:MAG: hypothetical protein ACPG6L_08345 [Nereida ignava]